MPTNDDLARRLQEDFAAAKAAAPETGLPEGAVGTTTFDQPHSEDGAVTVLLAQSRLQGAPAQSLVRVVSRGDGRRYLGVVTAGPFAEPDSLPATSPILKTVATRGGDYMPSYHGRVEVSILGEELAGGALVPPRLRPLPHSPVYRLSDDESARVLRAEGDLRLGLAVGHEALVVGVPTGAKAVLPRHTAVLGTTGGGKSTTVAGLVQRAREAGMAVVLLDVEGEYTQLHEPTTDTDMQAALAAQGREPAGLPADRVRLYHLVGRDTTNPRHPDLRPFALQFARLSPYTVMEMLGLNDAQTDRFLFAYDLSKALLRDLGIFPVKDATPEKRQEQEKLLLHLDEFERGHPRLTLSLFLDVVGLCKAAVTKSECTAYNKVLQSSEARQSLHAHLDVKQMPGSASSWGKLMSLLWRLNRLKVFDRHEGRVKLINYRELLEPGRVSIVDLSDAGMTELTNIAIADLLRGVQEAQDAAYRGYEKARDEGREAEAPSRVLLVLEEAHEFLGAERIEKMPVLFQQVARIAKRGRKRWLGLVFVTQLPQHLPRQVFGLVNNYVLHKITDPHVISALRQTVSGIDEGLWRRLAGLAPGQAVVSFGHMTRPLLTAIDPTSARLRLVD